MSKIQDALYGPEGLREMALDAVRTQRERILNDVKVNSPFETSPYFIAIFYRDMVFDVQLDSRHETWLEALTEARKNVESRLQGLSWAARSVTAEQAMKDQAEREACFKFLNATRFLFDD